MKGFLLRSVLIVFAMVMVAGCQSQEEKIADHMSRAKAFMDNQEWPEAGIEYHNVLRLDPNNAAAHYGLAEAMFAQEKLKEGYWELAETVRLDPSNFEARARFGAIARVFGQLEEASAQATAMIELNPKSADGWILKAQIFEAQKEMGQAEEYFLKALEIQPDQAGLRLLVAQFYSRQSDRQRAESHLRRYVEMDPSYYAFGHLASFLSADRFRDAESEQWYQKAIDDAITTEVTDENEESVTSIFQGMANFYFTRKRFEDAEAVLKKGLEHRPENLKYVYLLARFYNLQGKEDLADELMKNSTKIRSGEVGPYLTLSAYHHSRGDMEEAMKTLNEGLAMAPGDLSLRLRKAEFLLEKSFSDQDENLAREGREIIASVLDEDDKNAQGLYMKAKLDLLEDRVDVAVQELSKVVEIRPLWAQAHSVLGTALLLQGDLNGARAEVQKALELDASLLDARSLLARLYDRLGETKLAEEEALRVLSARPEEYDLRILLARVYIHSHNIGRALEQIELIPESHRSVEALFVQSQAMIVDGDVEEARALLLQLNQRDPLNTDVLDYLIKIAEEPSELEEVEHRVVEAVKKKPNDASLLHLEGVVYQRRGKIKEAEEVFQRAVDLNPNDLKVYHKLAEGYARSGSPEEVLKTFQDALRARPDSAAVNLILGILYEAYGQPGVARKHYETSLELNPNLAGAKNNLAYLLAEMGEELERALILAQEAKSVMPNSPHVSDTLGWVLYKKGVPSAAITYLKESLRTLPELDPNYDVVRYHLAAAYVDSDRLEEADSLLAEILLNFQNTRKGNSEDSGQEEPAWIREVRGLQKRVQEAPRT